VNRRDASIPFVGRRATRAPLNWGQRALWKSVEMSAPGDHQWLNFNWLVDVAPYWLSAEQVLVAVGATISRHEALRTRLVGAGRPTAQEVSASGAVPASVIDLGPDTGGSYAGGWSELDVIAEGLRNELAWQPFDFADEWPVRVGIVTREGVALALVLVVCHLYVDSSALRIVERDLHLELQGKQNPHPVGLTPCDLAEREAGLSEQSAAAARSWVKSLTTVPPNQVGEAEFSPSQGFRRLILHSQEISDALIAPAMSMGTSHTAIFAAAAVSIAKFLGQPRIGLIANVANRHQPDHKDIVGILLQRTLLVLDTTGAADDDESLRGLLSRVYMATLKAYRHSHYDQYELDRELEKIGRGGREIDPFVCVNDATRTRQSGPPTAAPIGALPRPAWTSHASFDWRLYFELVDACDVIRLTVSVDRRFATDEQIADLAQTFEQTIVRIASLNDASPTGANRTAKETVSS
jgi:hypothetical protein